MNNIDKKSNLEIFDENIELYESGILDGLICPRCRTETVSIKFQDEPLKYDRRSVYFICSKCNKYCPCLNRDYNFFK